MRQQRHDKVRAPGGRLVPRLRLGGGGGALSGRVTSVGGDKHRRPVLTLQRGHRASADKRKPVNTAPNFFSSGLFAAATETKPGVSVSNHDPTTQLTSRSSQYIPCTASRSPRLYQNKPYHSSAGLNGLTEKHSISVAHP